MMPLAFLLLSIALVVASLFLGGQPAAYWSTTAALLVLVGTVTVTLIGVRRGDGPALREGARRLLDDPRPDSARLARRLLDMAGIVRRDGAVALEALMKAERREPFLQRALGLVIDGLTPEAIERVLVAQIEVDFRRRSALAALLRRAGDVAPALGLIGTLIGLVGMMGQLDSPEQIGPAMATALLTTLYGAALAHVILFPLAERAEAQASALQAHDLLCVAGAAALGRGEHPLHLESHLNALLPPELKVQAA